MKKVYLYHRFERFWHWTQAALIILMMITGFEIHGSYTLLGFRTATRLHNVAAIALIILAAFAIFWHFTTGQWKQYVPTRSKLGAMAGYYLVGIFRGEQHPTQPTRAAKLNPLQRLSYVSFKLLIFPVMVTTGLLYLFYNNLVEREILPFQALEPIALLHTAGAFVLVAFLIVHVYMTTTGRTIFANIKAMFTGYKLIPAEEEAAEGRGKRIIGEAG